MKPSDSEQDRTKSGQYLLESLKYTYDTINLAKFSYRKY